MAAFLGPSILVGLHAFVRVLVGRALWQVVFVFPRRTVPLGLLVAGV